MKKNNHLKDWSIVEKKWQKQLADKEELLPNGLWEKIEGKLEVTSQKEVVPIWSFSKSFGLFRWSAAAVVLVAMLFYYKVEVSSSDIATAGSLETIKVPTDQHTPVNKPFSVSTEASSPSIASSETSRFTRVKSHQTSMKSVPTFLAKAAKGIPVQTVVQTTKAEIAEDKPVQSLVPRSVPEEIEGVVAKAPTRQQEVIDEMLVVVDVEPVKKEKVIQKVMGFLKKVKSGRILDLTTKSREGKLNDGIHQVMYQYEEKEEKLKNVLSL